MRHTLESRELSGFRIVESLYPARLRQPRHSHALASFSFVLTGTYLETFGARPAMRQPSTLVFHPPQESHSVDYQDRPVRILSVQIDSSRLSYLNERAIVFDSRATGRSQTIDWLGHRLYSEFRQTDSFSALALEGLVFEILAEAARTRCTINDGAPRWLRRAEEFLHDNFSTSFAFDDVARCAGVHPVHLARVFRKKHGCPMGEYLRRLRVEFAAKQIVTTNAALGDIAVAAGFSDQSHLTKTFKAHFGFTPAAYRKLRNSPSLTKRFG
jgi:AraC family transcriptional regulator